MCLESGYVQAEFVFGRVEVVFMSRCEFVSRQCLCLDGSLSPDVSERCLRTARRQMRLGSIYVWVVFVSKRIRAVFKAG